MIDTISRTAQSMALFRAIETTKRESRRLIEDPYAVIFLPPAFKAITRIATVPILRPLVESIIDVRYPGARSSGVARTRLIDDWLVSEADSGLDQIVVLGAGFDSRCLRLRKLATVPIYELDRQSVLAEKQRAYERADVEIPGNRKAIPIDFLQDTVSEKLLASTFRRAAKNIVLWEGVTNYLSHSAVTSVFSTFADISSAGTSIIFTYIHKSVLEDGFETVGLQRLRQRLVRWGEPWTFGFYPEQLPGFLADLGYELTNDLGAAEYRKIYYGQAATQLKGYEFYRVAKAKLVDPHKTIRSNTHASC